MLGMLLLCATAHAQLVPLRGVVQVVLGVAHSCGLTAAGAVQCWGENVVGQLGDGGATDRLTPVEVIGLGSGVQSIAAGIRHTCALTTGGTVKCWGSNGFGQLGDGVPIFRRSTPVDVVGLPGGVQAITAGNGHTCALTAGGGVKCWGSNPNGQLGDGSTTQRLAPVDVSGLSSGVQAISAGLNHTCALTSGGGVKCWGANGSSQLGDGTSTQRLTPVDVSGLGSGVQAISAGPSHTCALTDGGGVQCWGHGAYGQIGDGSALGRLTPVDVTGLASGVQAIRAGGYHTCAIAAGGAVKCWGDNNAGQLGDGTSIRKLTPIDVNGLGSGVQAISTGDSHTCAVAPGNGVRCWGRNSNGQIGDGSTTQRPVPVNVTGLGSGVQAISADAAHTCALTSGGAVKCWGNNGNGQLGDGSTTERLTAVDVSGLGSGVLAIGTGTFHTCALTSGNGVKCWGRNVNGQVGDGSFNNLRLTPVDVSGLASGVQAISTGSEHSCALTSGGGVKCWGRNTNGQLGDGSTDQRLTPVDVTGLTSGVQAIEACGNYTCALTTGGGVKCWGTNSNGQLGDGSTTQSLTPVDVTGLGSGVQAISGRTLHTCALTSGGGVKCWGNNDFGRLGDGTGVQRLTPVDVSGLTSGVQAISVGSGHTCALTSSGRGKCWGVNIFGQIGDGGTTHRFTPVDVSGLNSGVQAISAGQVHNCALTSGGGVKCWGNNADGQIGDGTFQGIPSPVAVLIDLDRPRLSSPSLAPGNANGRSVNSVSDGAGRYVVFQSAADNVPGPPDTNNADDIFRHDTQTGTTVRVSLDDAGNATTGASIEPSVSGDGQFVAFVAPDRAVAKVRNETKAQREKRSKTTTQAVFLRNIVTNSTFRAGPALPTGPGTRPVVAPDGMSVVVTAPNTDPALGPVGQNNVFSIPLVVQGGERVPAPAQMRCVTCKSLSSAGVPVGDSNGASYNATVSADGQWIAFETMAKNLLAADPSPCAASATPEVHLRHLLTGASQRISPPPSIAPLNCGTAGSRNPSMDWAAGRVVLESDQPIAPLDRNGNSDVYLFDLATGVSERVSEDPRTGHDGLSASVRPHISGNGRQVAFVSEATNVETSEVDNNETGDVVVYAVERRAARRVSNNRRSDQSNRYADRPNLSYDGSHVLFETDSDNLLLDPQTGQLLDDNDATDVYRARSPYLTRGGPDTVQLDGFEER